MPITWGTFQLPDGRRRPQIEFCEEGDWHVFDLLAARLRRGLGGRWIAQLDGVGQRYWDLEVDGAVITLHLEQMLGITVFAGGAGRIHHAWRS